MTLQLGRAVELVDMGDGNWALYRRHRDGGWRVWLTGLRAWRLR